MAGNLSTTTLMFVLAGGILPAIFWLWFWLREDRDKPEPRGLIILSFLLGALSILAVLPLESFARDIIGAGLPVLIAWATIEEVLKLAAAYLATWHRKALNEPVDYMIYLTTVALGFAAFENSLFLLKSVSDGGVLVSTLTLTMRFVGATLLHVLASSLLGGIFALAYCKGKFAKIMYGMIGLLVAIALHTAFNYFIIIGANIIPVFVFLWIGIVLLLIFFEKVKRVVCMNVPNKK